MHEMLTVVTDVRIVCLSVCLSCGLSRRRVQCTPRACAWGHLVQPSPNAFGLLFLAVWFVYFKNVDISEWFFKYCNNGICFMHEFSLCLWFYIKFMLVRDHLVWLHQWHVWVCREISLSVQNVIVCVEGTAVSVMWNDSTDSAIVFRLRQGWWACQGVCFGKRSGNHSKAAESSVLSETVSDSAAYTGQVCTRERFHVSQLLYVSNLFFSLPCFIVWIELIH